MTREILGRTCTGTTGFWSIRSYVGKQQDSATLRYAKEAGGASRPAEPNLQGRVSPRWLVRPSHYSVRAKRVIVQREDATVAGSRLMIAATVPIVQPWDGLGRKFQAGRSRIRWAGRPGRSARSERCCRARDNETRTIANRNRQCSRFWSSTRQARLRQSRSVAALPPGKTPWRR